MFDSPATNWLIVGLVLSALELVVPGVYLIWFGFAGFAMSIVMCFTEMVVTTQLIWFALISAIFALIGWYAYGAIMKKTETPREYRNLNNSAEQYVGMIVTVAQDTEDNNTKVKIGDTYWLAYSEKALKKGETAKVTGVRDNLILVIE